MTDTNRMSTSMVENMESGRVCLACRNTNTASAKQCRHCGRNLGLSQEPTDQAFVDDDPALLHADPNNRIDLETELACGFLRANGVACELSSMPLPRLAVNIISR
jgi:ribosomal protein L40E